MSDRPPLEQQAETHLKQALEADSPDRKDYHIRSALQLEACQPSDEHDERMHSE
jgi:hypothetical protein